MRLPKPLSYLFRRMIDGAPGSLFPLGADNIEAELPPPTANGQTIVANLALPNKMEWGDATSAGGWAEPEISLDEAGDPGIEFAINADGEWDIVMVWRVP